MIFSPWEPTSLRSNWFSPTTEHPFKEEFEHEEVITDRYAASTPAPSPLLQPTTAVPPVDRAEITASNTAMDQGQLEETPSLQGAARCIRRNRGNTVQTEKNDAEIPQNKPRPIGALRRHEYSRLFAKLLQGTSP